MSSASPPPRPIWRAGGRAPLDDEQQALLSRWGCPHVLERWHFHCTLSDLIPDEGERAVWLELARTFFAPALEQPRRCDALSLFVEPASARRRSRCGATPLSGRAPLRS